MELRTEHERMVFDLDNFHQTRLRPLTGEDQSLIFKLFPKSIIEFIAMPVTLGNLVIRLQLPRNFVRLIRFRPLLQLATVSA